jgi:hypothetical protein
MSKPKDFNKSKKVQPRKSRCCNAKVTRVCEARANSDYGDPKKPLGWVCDGCDKWCELVKPIYK